MFVRAYLETAIDIVGQYRGEEPLAAYLKKFFARHKKFGSRDRKQISHLCYCYFRLGHSVPQQTSEQRLLSGLFLCSNTPQPVLGQLQPEWNEKISLPLEAKIEALQQYNFQPTAIFPFISSLSPAIDPEPFTRSMLVQPDTFLRIRPGKKEKVLALLQGMGSAFDLCSEDCIALAPALKLEDVFALNTDVVVQDKSSQQVLSPLLPLMPEQNRHFEGASALPGGCSTFLADALFFSAIQLVGYKRDSRTAPNRLCFAVHFPILHLS